MGIDRLAGFCMILLFIGVICQICYRNAKTRSEPQSTQPWPTVSKEPVWPSVSRFGRAVLYLLHVLLASTLIFVGYGCIDKIRNGRLLCPNGTFYLCNFGDLFVFLIPVLLTVLYLIVWFTVVRPRANRNTFELITFFCLVFGFAFNLSYPILWAQSGNTSREMDPYLKEFYEANVSIDINGTEYEWDGESVETPRHVMIAPKKNSNQGYDIIFPKKVKQQLVGNPPQYGRYAELSQDAFDSEGPKVYQDTISQDYYLIETGRKMDKILLKLSPKK